MSWWDTFTAHLVAVLVGGLKVVFIGWLVYWLLRKKLLRRMLGDLQEQLPTAIPGPPLCATAAANAGVCSQEAPMNFEELTRRVMERAGAARECARASREPGSVDQARRMLLEAFDLAFDAAAAAREAVAQLDEQLGLVPVGPPVGRLPADLTKALDSDPPAG